MTLIFLSISIGHFAALFLTVFKPDLFGIPKRVPNALRTLLQLQAEVWFMALALLGTSALCLQFDFISGGYLSWGFLGFTGIFWLIRGFGTLALWSEKSAPSTRRLRRLA